MVKYSCIYLCSLFAPLILSAANDNLKAQRYFDLGDSLHRKSKYVKAGSYFKKAADKYEELKLWSLHVKSMNLYGASLKSAGDYDNALKTTFHSLKIAKKYLPDNDLQFLNTYIYLGILSTKTGRYEEALTYYFKVLDKQKKLFGQNHFAVIANYLNIGNAYYFKSDYYEAIHYYLQVLKLFDRNGDVNPYFYAVCYSNIAESYRAVHQIGLAEAYIMKAINMEPQDGEQIDMGSNYLNWGAILLTKGELENARYALEKSLSLQAKVFGPEHPQIAVCHENIGELHLLSSNYPLAEQHYRKCLDIWLKIMAGRHPETADAYNELGSLYLKTKDYRSAVMMFHNSLGIFNISMDVSNIYANPAIDRSNLRKQFLNALEGKAMALYFDFLYN